jgi:hypothetical protein
MTNEHIDKAKFWRRHIKQWSKSGISKAAYCVKHELSLHQMGYWRKRLKHHDGALPASDARLFEPVIVDSNDATEVETCLGVQIVFPSGIMIECTPTTDMAWLAALAGEVHRM